MADIIDVPHFPQESETGCLLACLQMVLAFHGIRRSQTSLARQLGWQSEIGLPGSVVARLGSSQLDVYYGSGTLDDLHSWLSRQEPVIVLVQASELPYWSEEPSQHAVVAVGMDQDHLFMLDPTLDDRVLPVPLGDFLLAWEAIDCRYAVLRMR